MGFGLKIVSVLYDILRGVNVTIWGGVQEAKKVGKIVKTGLSGADIVIRTNHAFEDFGRMGCFKRSFSRLILLLSTLLPY